MIGLLWQRGGLTDGDLLLQGRRVYLRPPVLEDYPDWVALREQSREFLVPWEPAWSEDGLTRAAFRRRLRRYAIERRAGTGCNLLIFRESDNTLLGGIGLGNIRRAAAQSASVGYWIGAPYARQGYMSEALEAVLAFSFDRLGLHRVEAACLPKNAASRALLRRAGFKREGIARQYLCINGLWQDHEIHALLREDRYGPS